MTGRTVLSTDMSLTINNETTIHVGITEHAQKTNGNISGNMTRTSVEDEYDAVGAMQFIVATVLVYSIFGVFCTLLTRFKREHGRGNLGYVQDEMVLKYIKNEKFLKLDGFRMKLLCDTQVYAEKIRLYEEKVQLSRLEKDIESDFSTHKAISTTRFDKKLTKNISDVGSTVGKMGISLLHFNSKNDLELNSRSVTSNQTPFMQDCVLKQETEVDEESSDAFAAPLIKTDTYKTSVTLETDV